MVRRLDPATTYDEQAFITNSTYSKQIVSSSAATAFLKQYLSFDLEIAGGR